jgi:hypothetical protein
VHGRLTYIPGPIWNVPGKSMCIPGGPRDIYNMYMVDSHISQDLYGMYLVGTCPSQGV